MHTCYPDIVFHTQVIERSAMDRLVGYITHRRPGAMGQGMIYPTLASITAPILAFITVHPIVSLVAALVGMAVTSQPAYTVPTIVRRCGR